MKPDPQEKAATIKELRRLAEEHAKSGQPPPRAIGGPFSLTAAEMIDEVERDTEVGQKIVAAFASLRKQLNGGHGPPTV